MALDTRNKRAAAIHVSLPFRGLLPEPDGAALSVQDRQQTAFMSASPAATAVTFTAADSSFFIVL